MCVNVQKHIPAAVAVQPAITQLILTGRIEKELKTVVMKMQKQAAICLEITASIVRSNKRS